MRLPFEIRLLESQAQGRPVVGSKRILEVIELLKRCFREQDDLETKISDQDDTIRDLRARLDTGVQGWLGEKEALAYIHQLEDDLRDASDVIGPAMDIVDSQIGDSHIKPVEALKALTAAVNLYCDKMKAKEPSEQEEG